MVVIDFNKFSQNESVFIICDITEDLVLVL